MNTNIVQIFNKGVFGDSKYLRDATYKCINTYYLQDFHKLYLINKQPDVTI